jgi:ubiquinone/menaquinone biosynthesis C-methylase UbiE
MRSSCLVKKFIQMIKLYDKYLLPRITHHVCASGPASKQRQKVVPHATGRVLEIGAGSGLNFGFYSVEKVEYLFALEPSPEMRQLAQQQDYPAGLSLEFVESGAEAIPLPDNSVDTIVSTFTLCSVAELRAALSEMRRVLKPGGEFLFCEHGLAPDLGVRRWQNFLNPAWKKLGGGCHLNRNIPRLIEAEFFSIHNLETMYLPGFKPAGFNYWGMARPVL